MSLVTTLLSEVNAAASHILEVGLLLVRLQRTVKKELQCVIRSHYSVLNLNVPYISKEHTFC